MNIDFIKSGPLSLLLVVAATSGCLKQTIFEKEAVLSANVSKVEILAEGEKVLDPDARYDSQIFDTVIVTTNRNFSSKIEPEVDWVTLESDGESNLSGTLKQFPVVLVFARNRVDEPRSTELVFYSEGGTLRIPVTQGKPAYFMEATIDRQEVIPLRDTSTLIILSNTRWTAALDSTLTDARVTLSKTAGRDNGRIGVCFGYNFDLENSKKAVVKVKPENLDTTFTYTITQRDAQPFIEIRQNDFTSAPEDPYSTFTINANTDWTIEMVEDGFKNGRIVSLDDYKANSHRPDRWTDASSGGYGEDQQLIYIAEHGIDPEVLEKKVTLIASVEDGTSSDTLRITQKGCIHLDFLDIDPGKLGQKECYRQHYQDSASWPFSDPDWDNRCTSYNACFNEPDKFGRFNGNIYPEQSYTIKGGYVMPLLAHPIGVEDGHDGGVWYNGRGFQIGRCSRSAWGIYDYLKTPAIENMALRKIILEPNFAEGGNDVWVKDADGREPVPGFYKAWKYPVKGSAKVEHEEGGSFTYEFPDSALVNNTSYRISFERRECNSNIKELVLIYE